MRKKISLLSIAGLLFACTPVENNPAGKEEPGGNGNQDKTVHVTSISLDRTSATIKEGESITLVATIKPDNADNKAVIWSSSSDAVATVDASGKVTGVKTGSATITATTEDGDKTAICAVTVEQNLAPSVTVGADHISAVSVVLQGKANVDNKGTSLVLGFQYYKMTGSESPSVTTLISTNADEGNNYTVAIPGLEPSTTYRYWSFVRQNGQDTYGETMEFTTKDIATLLETKETSDVEATSALLNAKLDLTDVQYKTLAYGFLWGTSEAALNTDYKCTEISDNAISAALTNLSHKTKYWYKAYVKLDSQTFYGEVKTFTTDVVPVESVSLDKEYTFNTIGNSLILKATVLPADATDKSVEWSSDKEDVAVVDANGRVTAKGNGKATITVTTKDQGKTASCEVTVAQWVTSISLNKTSLSLVIGDEVMLSVTRVLPDNANEKSYIWSSSDSAIASVDNSGKITAKAKGKVTIKATANDGSGVNTTCSVVVSSKCPTGAVDMGTTTAEGYKMYWATCNIGASSPEVYGDYYAWGETETKSDHSWSNYKFGTSSSGPFLKYSTNSSYGAVDNKTMLDPEDDAAHVKLGGDWRMPTEEEWTELKTKCTWTWTSDYSGTGVSGRIVTATNGNRIFLPAAGFNGQWGAGTSGRYGSYWSSSLYADSPDCAWAIIFRQSDDNVSIDKIARYTGRSVRPVTE